MALTLTVVTITYQAQAVLQRTLASVAEQTYPHIEHVLIDGNSRDGTCAQIAEYAASRPHVVWQSEPDGGLYDAMNKGLARATGDYVCFLNAGDCFAAPDTVAQVMAQAAGADALYGHTLMVDDAGNSLGFRTYKQLPAQLSWRSFRHGMVVSHQALIVRRTLAQPYDLRYTCAADIDWAIRSLRPARKVVHTGLVIDHFLEGGVSHTRRKKCLKERWHIIRRHFGLPVALWVHGVIVLKWLLRGGKWR